jgi:hypothetical protein
VVIRCVWAALSTACVAAFLATGGVASSAAAVTPTRSTWAAAANAVCRVAYAKIRKLPKDTTPALVLADGRATARIGKRMDAQVAAIPRPAGAQVAIAALVANSHAEERLFAQLLQALASGNVPAAQAAAKKLGPLGTKYNRAARALGASVCAENPQPSG